MEAKDKFRDKVRRGGTEVAIRREGKEARQEEVQMRESKQTS